MGEVYRVVLKFVPSQQRLGVNFSWARPGYFLIVGVRVRTQCSFRFERVPLSRVKVFLECNDVLRREGLVSRVCWRDCVFNRLGINKDSSTFTRESDLPRLQ